MSIVTIRTMLYEKKGCQAIAVGLMALVAVGFLLPSMCNRNAAELQQQGGAIVQVNGKNVTESDMRAVEEQMNQQMPADSGDPRQRVQRLAMVTNQLVRRAALQSIADRENVKPTEEMVRSGIASEIDSQLMMMRLQMQFSQQLKQDATDAEFDEALKKQAGMTSAEYKKRVEDELNATFSDPAKKQALLTDYLGQALTDHYAKKYPATEAEFKKSTETLVLNRLAISDDKLSEDQRNAKAEEARKELASGKPFGDVYKKYVGKSSPAPTELAVSSLESQENLKPLLDLKDKEVSGVISEFGNPIIYQLVTRKEVLPPDFEKNKQKELENFSKVQGSKKLDDDIKAITNDSTKLNWKLPAFKLFYQYAQALTEPATKAGDFMAIADEAGKLRLDPKAANGSDLSLLEYVAFEDAFERSSASEKIALKERKAALMSEALSIQDNAQLRAQLADLQHELKLYDDAAGSLSKAIENTITYDAAAETFVKGLEQRALAWEKDKTFTSDHVNLVKDALQIWRSGKSQWEKDQAELKAMEEEARKEAAKEQARLEAESKKQGEELDKQEKAGTTGAPATTGSSKPSGQ